MDFFEVLRRRYSVRAFDSAPVEAEKIERILEVARQAPTAVNKQPQRIVVLQSPEEMAKLAGCTKYTFGAPAALIVGYDAASAWVRPYDNENSGIIDASIVGTLIMLTVCELDLGTCWVGYFDPEAVRRTFSFPESVQPAAIFPIGYPARDAAPSPRHEQRLPLAETVRYGSFQD